MLQLNHRNKTVGGGSYEGWTNEIRAYTEKIQPNKTRPGNASSGYVVKYVNKKREENIIHIMKVQFYRRNWNE